LLEKVLKESKNKPFLADVFYYLPNTENQPLSPQPIKTKVANPQRVSDFFSLCSPTFRFFVGTGKAALSGAAFVGNNQQKPLFLSGK